LFLEKKVRKNNMKKINNKIKRGLRNRKKLKSVAVNRYRISIFKSLKNISAQIIDDKDKKTLVSASSIEKEVKSNKMKKIETSVLLGEILAKRAAEKKITKVYFDRGAYKYHGRIKMFADSLRKNGMEF
jgi:large subunit ribosomal protein L18